MRFFPRFTFKSLTIWLCLAFFVTRAMAAEPERVEYCQLKRDPSAYNHKLVEVKAFFTHGFEDSAMFDPDCASFPQVWVEFGGRVKTGTMYCCGESNTRTRLKPLTVENVQIDLTEDDTFKVFDKLFHSGRSSIVYATVIGRFFAGEKMKWGPTETRWGGYGHMGCCSLIAIERVTFVDLHDNADLDYSNSNVFRPNCSYQTLEGTTVSFQLRALQRAESGDSWAFSDATRVAQDAVERIARDREKEVTKNPPRITKISAGLLVYQWHAIKDVFYIFVVSKPYLLSIYANDPKKVPWVVTNAYNSSCALK
jgi:hypothetical protein